MVQCFFLFLRLESSEFFAPFSVKAVMNVAHYVLSLPTGLTEGQRNQRIAD